MNEYIFYTTAGYSLAPVGEIKVENCRVLGFAKGHSADAAKERLLAEEAWIAELDYADAPILSRQVLPPSPAAEAWKEKRIPHLLLVHRFVNVISAND